MMILTAKVDIKKILLILAVIAAVILGILLLSGNGDEKASETSAPTTPTNESRVEFLKGFGWEVVHTPKESGLVKIPEESSDVFERYNALQKGQGYDLTKYAGKKVMRYVYSVNNYPGATEPVYATILVFKNRIIGGDITNTAVSGQMQGFEMPAVTNTTAPTLPSIPSEFSVGTTESVE